MGGGGGALQIYGTMQWENVEKKFLLCLYLCCIYTYAAVEESADEPQWLMASKENGKRGLVPANYVEKLP